MIAAGCDRKTALRLVLNLMNRSDELVDAFAEAFQAMKRESTHAGNATT